MPGCFTRIAPKKGTVSNFALQKLLTVPYFHFGNSVRIRPAQQREDSYETADRYWEVELHACALHPIWSPYPRKRPGSGDEDLPGPHRSSDPDGQRRSESFNQ